MTTAISPPVLIDRCYPPRSSRPSCIKLLEASRNNYELKYQYITMLPKFSGLEYEDAYKFISEFEEVCVMKIQQLRRCSQVEVHSICTPGQYYVSVIHCSLSKKNQCIRLQEFNVRLTNSYNVVIELVAKLSWFKVSVSAADSAGNETDPSRRLGSDSDDTRKTLYRTPKKL